MLSAIAEAVRHCNSAKRLVHSRCYVNFADPGAIPAFKRAVEAHAFVTERGAQYRGCVEYAPFQKVPEQRVKRDPREGTLDAGARTLCMFLGLMAALLQCKLASSRGLACMLS
jgi:regulator of nonsense transcripts 3